jgi:DNA-binding CsgD family transcriptional regulator
MPSASVAVMTTEVEALLEQGGAALATGEWERAADIFRAALDIEDRPDAHYGVATALWWLGDIPDALRAWNVTYSAYCRAGSKAEAAQAAINLAIFYATHIGNPTVASGWLRRAARHAQVVGDPLLDAWVRWAEAAVGSDRARAVELAEGARVVAVEHGDRDLEICALSVTGWALVGLGRADEGVALLDEALAGAIGGESQQLDTIVLTSCLLMEACRDCADFERIVHWMPAIDDFVEQYGCPYLNATCRTHYGEVLAAVGDWTRADQELQHAIRLAAHSLPAVRAIAAACLAELRLAQGRVDEARALLVGLEDRGAASVAVARLAIADGSMAAAEATVVRRLAQLGDSEVQAAPVRELLGELRLAAGDLDGASHIARDLSKQGHAVGCSIIVCRAARLAGRTLIARGEPDAARVELEAALSGFAELGLIADVARTRFGLAQLLATDQPELARAEGRAAHAMLESLGAAPESEAVRRWLAQHGDLPNLARTDPIAALTRRECDVVRLICEGHTNPEIAERLYISRRTVEHHVASILSKLGLRNRTEVAALVTAAVDP